MIWENDYYGIQKEYECNSDWLILLVVGHVYKCEILNPFEEKRLLQVTVTNCLDRIKFDRNDSIS